MPSSVVNLFILGKSIRGEAKIPLAELQNAVGEQQGSKIKSLFLKQYFQKHIAAISGQQRWTTIIDSVSTFEGKDPIVGSYKEVLVYFELKTAQENLRKFTFNYDAVVHQVITHKIFVYVEQDWLNGIQDKNKTQQIGIIQLDIPKGKIFPLEVNLEKGSWWTGFKGMVHLGLEHIKEGTDHLLFLLVLLLPASLTVNHKRWGNFGGTKYSIVRLLKIITAFTIGHSITLLIGVLGWFHLPTQPVEILIAVSILVSAIHAIYPVFPGKEIYVASGFGLIHGLAFATVLSNLNLDTGTMILSILGFNIGIEIMQLFVIILTIPWLILLSQTPSYRWIRISWAILAAIAAFAWITERLSGNANTISTAIQNNISIAPWGILLLAVTAISLYGIHWKNEKLQEI
ncbi:HupE/UreJ family protein [Flavobacterium sp. ZT3R18]|nr:HupE/UreJ family protein [Flavobacterium sp. ZT3R18]